MRSNILALTCSVLPLLHPCTAAPTVDLGQIIFSSHSTNASDIQAALKEGSVIPDVLDDFTPSVSLHLSYPSSHSDVSLGNDLSLSAVQASPFFSISPFTLSVTPSRTLKPDTTYTLALTDPDATSRSDPKMAEMCHWIATNITLDSSTAVVFTPTFDELMPYVPPSPPPKTGYHRYVFVLLAPSSSTEALSNAISTTGLDLKKPKDRPHWGYGKKGKGVRDWAEDNDLVVVGANFFYAENEKQ